MKAILEFDLSETDDIYAHRRAISATDAFLVLHDIISTLSRAQKEEFFNGNRLSRGGLKLISEIQTAVNDIIENYDVNLNNLE